MAFLHNVEKNKVHQIPFQFLVAHLLQYFFPFDEFLAGKCKMLSESDDFHNEENRTFVKIFLS